MSIFVLSRQPLFSLSFSLFIIIRFYFFLSPVLSDCIFIYLWVADLHPENIFELSSTCLVISYL